MVRTRHRLGPSEEIDDDDEASPKFFSLETEKNRKSMKSNNIIEDSGDRPSHTYSGRNAYNIFEEKVVDSRLRPRTGPSRAYNYLDVDSSDEEFRRTRQQHCQRSTFGSRGSRQLKQEMMEDQRKGSTHQLRRRPSEAPDHSLTEEEDEEHKDNSCRRTRSSRIRRQIYHSLNQSHLFRNLHQDKDELDGRHDQSDVKDQDSDDDQTFSDMYSRVKRKRVQVKRNMYGVPINEDSDSEPDERNRNNSKNDEEGEDDEDEDDDDGGEEEENEKEDDDKSGSLRIGKFSLRKRKPCKQVVKSYSLREHKPRTDLYKAPVEERKNRRIDHSIFAVTPTKKSTNQTYQSPAQRINIRKRSAFHSSSSSTSSSSDSESSDEKKFKHRKAKSMAKARKRMMPMNFSTNALPAGSVIKDRVKSGASLADVEPMNIDKNVTFNSIGGLGKHIRALKEMVVFPLLYDKVFQRFKVDPPRGVLFYGPPGTGKTLVARALANECSNGDKRVAFFMRKGADCLSKWVGESERQLRLLFDQAYKFRPSIIFFDEIDGLAPVRSSRQDQIHSSIVSTLLALMDGLDSRGEIVVIGATNRIDSLDPALRRPGRFDREFLFSLPPLEARKQILKIHTASWTPKLNDNFISELAGKCVGYCGADLKALCTEAAMLALRRRYPQIYISNEALQLDVSSINVSAKDFFDAVSNIIPTSQRAVNTPARALSPRVCPLLQNQLNKVMDRLGETYPPCVNQVSSLDAAATSSQAQTLAENGAIWEELESDEDEDTPSIFVPSTASSNNKSSVTNDERYSNTKPLYLNYINYATSRPTTFRPRLILVGHEGQGQTNYIARAVIHKMESLPVHVLDLPALYAVTAKTPEESCANVFHEAKRKCPSIIYLPYINQWWDVMAETLRATLLTLIQDLDPSLPLLLLATSEQPYYQLDPVLQSLFSNHCGEVFKMSNPDNEERRMFFKDLLLQQACRPPPQRKQAGDIIKLLEQSKPAGLIPSKQSFSKQRFKDGKRRFSSKLPNFIYPLGKAQHAAVSDSMASKRCTYATKMSASCDKQTKQCKIKTLKCVASKTKSAFGAVPFLLPRASLKYKHRMVLRSRTRICGHNSNQSAKQSRQVKRCPVVTSDRPAITLTDMNVEFKTPLEPHPDFKLKCSAKMINGNELFAGKGTDLNSLSERQQQYLQRLHKLEAKLAILGSSHSEDCHNPMSRHSHCSLTSRHLRYLRRLRKLDSVICSRVSSAQPDKCARSSVFACGSFQMLFKKDNRPCSVTNLRSELVLPINLRECHNGSQRMPHTSNNGQKSLSTSLPFQMKLANKRLTEMQIFSRNPRYNLRSRKPIKRSAQRMLEVLPVAAASKPRELTKEELELLVEKEELTLMELRIFLRDVLNKLGSDKKFSIFAKPVNIEDAFDYYEVIEHPMDLSTMMSKIDLHEYVTVQSFLNDINLVCSNALEYNPDRGPMDRIIRNRACALKDTAYAIIKTELDKDFEKMCVEIEESRKRRGQKSTCVPNFYYTQRSGSQQNSRSQPTIPSYLENLKPVRSIPKPEGERYSRRVRGLNIDPTPPLESVEKVYRAARSAASPDGKSKSNDTEESSQCNTVTKQQTLSSSHPTMKNEDRMNTNNCLPSVPQNSALTSKDTPSQNYDGAKSVERNSGTAKRRKTSTCVWCRPKRKRHRLTISKIHNIHHRGGVDREVRRGKEESTRTSKPLNQQLTVDVAENSAEDKDVASHIKVSSSHKSPSSNPVRVSSRRSSMSPQNIGISSASTSILSPTRQASSSHHSAGTNNAHQEAPSELQKLQEAAELLSNGLSTEMSKESKTDADSSSLFASPHPCGSAEKLNEEKSSVVKRLDLAPVIVDSGVGSSVDSNGDSRDSTDHSRLQEGDGVQTGKICKTNDWNQNCNAALNKRARAILNESSKTLVIDNQRLTALLEKLVCHTEGANVERLEKIYSHLSLVIYRHRHEYNRTNMIMNLEKKVDDLLMPSTSTPCQSKPPHC